jgi:DNA-binding response OmpR family regulator
MPRSDGNIPAGRSTAQSETLPRGSSEQEACGLNSANAILRRKAPVPTLSHAHVLVADDDPQLLDAVADGLTRLGADVIRATSGANLIEQLASAGPFDLVVTDISMPWMSGLQAIRSTRAAGLATSVIVMTALTDERIPAQVRALGGKALLLRKPFELGELESAASKLLADTQP